MKTNMNVHSSLYIYCLPGTISLLVMNYFTRNITISFKVQQCIYAYDEKTFVMLLKKGKTRILHLPYSD